MSRVLLIPGFATEARVDFLRNRRGLDAGFGAARTLLDTGQATAFRWGIATHAAGLAGLNPRTYLRLYATERRHATRATTLRALHALYQAQQPEVVLCHSMGCRVWLHFVQQYALLPNLRKVVFVQADVPATFVPGPAEVQARLTDGTLTWLNLWCGWDQALLSSAMLNGIWPAGLVGARYPHVRNQFFPLYRRWNLHTSSINDARLLRFAD